MARKKLISKLFVRHFQEINSERRKKSSIDCLIKLNEDDWMFEKGVKPRNQRIAMCGPRTDYHRDTKNY